MTGIALSTFSDDLRKVPVHRNHNPAATFDGLDLVGPHARAYIADRFSETTFNKVAHYLPMKAFARLTFDQLCKVRYSSDIMMCESVENEFRTNPRYVIVNKIKNSMWRWGYTRGTWNEIVDSYKGIRDFNLGPDFDVALDYTTGHNEQGYSEHSRTFLDGVFAFLVYYRGEHVMTVGFSLSGGRKLLIQQVQLVKRRGNRFLFRMPNRMEFIIGQFKAVFPSHNIYVVDGGDIARKSLGNYRGGLANARDQVKRLESSERTDWGDSSLLAYKESIKGFSEKIAHLTNEVDRLADFYRNTGIYSLGKVLRINQLNHYRVGE